MIEINYKETIDRLTKHSNAKSDADIARALEISPQALFTFKKRGKLPSDLLIKYCLKHQLSIDWLLTGEDYKTLSEGKEVMSAHENDPKLAGLMEKLAQIYKEGSLKERAEVRGIIEEVYDEIGKTKK